MEQEHPEPTADRPEPAARPTTGRRKFLALLGRAGLVVVGGVATATAATETAGAHPRPPCGPGLYQSACCCLARAPGSCPGSGAGFNCNRGRKRIWSCCSGNRQYICGECTGGSNCKQGPFYCSEVYRTGRNC
jgi:hypothetical protein